MRRALVVLTAIAFLAGSGGPAVAAKGSGGGMAPSTTGVIYGSDDAIGGAGPVGVRADGTGFAATCAGDPTRATPREFVSVRDADGALMWSSETCHPEVLLADQAKRAGTPEWSPDDTRIAFLAFDPTTEEEGYSDVHALYVADVVRGAAVPSLAEVRLVAQLPSTGTFDWAPSGDKLVVSQPNPAHKANSNDPDSWSPPDLYVVSLDGAMANVTNTTRPEYYPAWSPDGTRIAFTTQTVFKGSARADVFTMSSTGGTAAQVTSKSNTSASNNRQPVWSPDGAQIAFACTATSSGFTHVCRIDSAGRTKATDLTPHLESMFAVRAWRESPRV